MKWIFAVLRKISRGYAASYRWVDRRAQPAKHRTEELEAVEKATEILKSGSVRLPLSLSPSPHV